MVVIWALCRSVDWRWMWAESGLSVSRFEMPAAMRSRISAAAALVKVTTNRRSMSTGCASSQTMRTMRSTNTAVLPLPAAADTRMFRP